MRHPVLVTLFASITLSAGIPCAGQTPASSPVGAPCRGGVLMRIADVPFPHSDYSSRVVRELERRFMHTAPNDTLAAQVKARIRRDGAVDSIRVVMSSSDTSFDRQAQTAVQRASMEHAFGRLPTTFADSALPVLLTFTASYGVNLARTAASPDSARKTPGSSYEFRIEKPVVLIFGAPRYPEMLRKRGITGEVLAEFVVDTTGHVDTTTVQVLRSAHPLFTQAVLNAMAGMRFIPAEVGGRRVKQLVTQPFDFSISAPPPKDTAVAPRAKPAVPPKRPVEHGPSAPISS